MPNGTLRGVRGRGNYLIFLPTRFEKYKFYVNIRTKNHPSLELSSNKKKWKKLELTSSPIKTGRYIELKINLDPKQTKKHLSGNMLETIRLKLEVIY